MKPFTIALVGNPNCGKTTLFNLLTKSGEAVGNRAGVTFSVKKEPIRKYTKENHIMVLDLPGIYSLDSQKNEEKTAFSALKTEKIDVILNILDATDLERGLTLTLSLLSLDIPIVLALNMIDELPKMGMEIDLSGLKHTLNIPIFPISAAKNTGIRDLIAGCLHIQKQSIPTPAIPFQNSENYAQIARKLCILYVKTTKKPNLFTDRIDAVICRPIVGIPLFFAVISLVFYLTFSSLGSAASAWLERIFEDISVYLHTFLLSIGVNDFLCRFLTDGVWMGVAAVLSFLPQTAILFFLLAVLEDSGYLARAAFVMDDLMRPFGLSGKAMIPMLIGFGCTVPAIMSTATLNEEEKEAAVMSLPLIPCSARLPVILWVSDTFFLKKRVFFAVFLYFLCIVTACFSALFHQKKGIGKKAPPLLLELPKYRLPLPVSLFREVKNKLRDFVIRAGTVVFLSCVLITLLAMLTPSLTPAVSGEASILAHLGKWISPIFAPLGFANAELSAAFIAGFFAKESIVSTIHILIPNGITSLLSPAQAFSFAVYSLLYIPCAASLSAIRKELGIKNMLFCLCRMGILAFFVSYICYTAYRICII